MRTALPIAFVALALTGCSAVAVPTPAPSESPSAAAADPSTVLDLGPVGNDVDLVVTAVATAADGAKLALELRVRRAVPVDDVGSYTVVDAVLNSCPETVDRTLAANESWSFNRVNVLATAPAGSADWASADRITIRPSASLAPVTAMSYLLDADGAPSCSSDKYLAGVGKGAIAFGLAADSTYQRWASLDYGFSTAGTGITLSDCTFRLTPDGSQLGGGSGDWVQTADSTTCVAGAANPTRGY